jgi:hypothetical protein
MSVLDSMLFFPRCHSFGVIIHTLTVKFLVHLLQQQAGILDMELNYLNNLITTLYVCGYKFIHFIFIFSVSMGRRLPLVSFIPSLEIRSC